MNLVTKDTPRYEYRRYVIYELDDEFYVDEIGSFETETEAREAIDCNWDG